MEAIKINGHELTGANLTEIADKILQGKTSYENLPWMQQLQRDLAAAAGSRDAELLRLLTEGGHPYHFGFLSAREYDAQELERLWQLVK